MSLRKLLAASIATLATITPCAFAGTGAQPVDVPRIEGIQIDGDVSDWGDGGFRLDMLHSAHAARRDVANGSARVRLAWDDRGLLLRFDVKDDKFSEADSASIWFGDCIELFTSSRVGGHGFVQYLVQPGLADDQPTLRFVVKDERDQETFDDSKLGPDVARKAVNGGYAMEIRLPWDAFDITRASEGKIAALTFNVSDVDSYRGPRAMLLWHPEYGVWGGNTHRMCAFRLTRGKPSPTVVAIASTRYSDFAQDMTASVQGVAELAGKTVDVRSGGKPMGAFTLVEEGGWTKGAITLASPPRGASPDALQFVIDGETVATAQPMSVDAVLARQVLDDLNPAFDRHVFSGTQFPTASLTQPLEMRMLIGPYTIQTQFYNAKYEEVTEAAEPGRYGAIVRVVPESGITYTRYRTLYRAPQNFSWRSVSFAGQADLPEQFGIDGGVLHKQAEQVVDSLKAFAAVADQQGDDVAVLLAGLAEMSPSDPPANAFTNAQARDRQWWVTLKRKLQGTDKLWPNELTAPSKILGKPATMLHEGTMAEAGMVPDAPARLDAVLTEWANDTDEAFIAVVVRHGVVVLHKAYGMRDGKPMTVNTVSRMASLTKLMNGTGMMMLVDRGLVDLDAPISTYLPAFKGRRTERPIIVRDLFVHTAGMWGHWGDQMNDFDLRVAEYAPYLEVGKQFSYNGMDLAIGGKIMEAVTSRSLPNFYKQYLFDPLEMSLTTATTGGYDARSVAMDMAKFGQMLCNGGAYGDRRFISPESLEKMLPQMLTKTLGDDAGKVWGIGTEWLDRQFLSDRTFGHGSAAMATLRIDLDNDLVISMTRNSGGKHFDHYHNEWFDMIADCMINPKLSDRALLRQADRRTTAADRE